MYIFTIILFCFFIFCSNSNPVARDVLIESTLAKQFNRRSTNDQACRDLVSIYCKREKPLEYRVDIYESCLVDGFIHHCGTMSLIRDFDVDMDTNFFENSGMDVDMDPA